MLEAVHDESAEVLEDLGSEDLGEEVSQVLGGLDVDGSHDVLIAEALHPLLAAVDVLQVGFEAGALDEGDGSGVVDAKLERLGEVHAKLLDHV